jgi:NodT family efflux transporter outer membrane factor (OMF) lipoprotein
VQINKQIPIILFMTAGLMTAVFFGGCAQPEPKPVDLSFDLPEAFSFAGGERLSAKWWQSFDDRQLDALIEQALSDNFSIRSAWDRLTAAEQIAIKAGTDVYPSVNYSVGAERTRRETGNVTSYTSEYSAGLTALYEVDLWGRIRSSQQAAKLDVRAAQEAVNVAAVTLSASIAKTWYQLAEAKQKSQVISVQLETNRKVLEVIKLQFRQGLAGAADVFRQEQLAESSRGQLIQSEETVVLLQHQLSVLLGQPPALRWADDTIELVALGQMPVVDVPAVVIQRRPDVRAAFTAVQAADRRTAAAIADQYPTISLSATVATSTDRVNDLFDDWLANIAANLTGPLIDAGLRKAEVERTKAVLSETINTYSQTVLEALQEVEDAINQEHYQRQTVENLQKQLALSRKVYDRIRQRYIKGQADYLRVLETLVSQQTLEQRELAARRVLVERRIDVCRAVAGSWELVRPENAKLEIVEPRIPMHRDE